MEIRILGIDPDQVAEAATRLGYESLLAPKTFAGHAWRECHVVDPDGYVFAVGSLVPTQT